MHNRTFEFFSNAAIALIVFYGLYAALKILLSLPLWNTELLSKSGAAWAQAILSVAAIIATWMGTRHQLNHQQRLRDQERRESREALAQIAYDLSSNTQNALNSIFEKMKWSGKTQVHTPIGLDRLIDLQESLRIFATKDIDARIYTQLLVIQRELAYTITAVKEYSKSKFAHPDRVEKAKSRLEKVFIARMKLENELMEARKALGLPGPVSTTSEDSTQ